MGEVLTQYDLKFGIRTMAMRPQSRRTCGKSSPTTGFETSNEGMGEMDNKLNKQSCSSDKGELRLSRRDAIKGGTMFAAALGITPLMAAYGGGVIGKASAATAAAANADPYPFPDLSGKTITFVDYGGAGARAMEEAYTQ